MAEEANRLFKQEFGDKIESLQQEVEQLRRQRTSLEQELRKERDRRGGPPSDALMGKTPPQKEMRQQVEDIKRELETVKKENDLLRNVLEEKTSLSSSLSCSHEDEQEQPCKEPEPSICQMCECPESLTRPKGECKNCREVFCESCITNELPLPSSINPEHVCNACYSTLMHQYASTPT